MATIEFYTNLDYDFSIYEGEKELFGLTPGGFNGSEPLHIENFNELELKAARDIIACYLRPIKSINQEHTSFGLKHLVERMLAKETNNKINYISNGAIILAMYDARYRIKRLSDTLPNCYFNVSNKSARHLYKIINSNF